MIHHIANYRGDKGFIYFVLQNQFSQLELKMDVRLVEITQLKIIIRPTRDNFQKIWNNNGIDIQREDLKIHVEEVFKESIEQYYFIDSRNQIHLLFPSYTEKSKKREIIERIMKETSIQ